MGIEDLAVLEAVPRLLKLVQGEEAGLKTGGPGGLPDLVLVLFGEEFQTDADFAHNGLLCL